MSTFINAELDLGSESNSELDDDQLKSDSDNDSDNDSNSDSDNDSFNDSHE